MLRCPECGLAHFPTEVHRESERGREYNAKLARARSALAASPQTLTPAAQAELTEALTGQKLSKAAPAVRPRARNGGRPPGPKPWKDRMLEHRRDYMRAYRLRKRPTSP